MIKTIRNSAAIIALLPALASPALGGGNAGYPIGATPIAVSTTGTTAATAVTLPAVPGQTTYLCGFSIRSTATVGSAGTATVTGTSSGTLNYTHWSGPVASGGALVPVEPSFGPDCIPASAINTTITVTSAAPGGGGVVSVTAWGFQL
jgi:hypothetical protein